MIREFIHEPGCRMIGTSEIVYTQARSDERLTWSCCGARVEVRTTHDPISTEGAAFANLVPEITHVARETP